MQRIAETTTKVIAFLESHARVRKVYSPRATGNPQLALSAQQLHGASGLVTIELDAADVPAVERFCDSLRRFLMTVSWGGYESLLFPVAAVHPVGSPLTPAGALPLNLVRLSIGLEEPDVLIGDLDQALARL